METIICELAVCQRLSLFSFNPSNKQGRHSTMQYDPWLTSMNSFIASLLPALSLLIQAYWPSCCIFLISVHCTCYSLCLQCCSPSDIHAAPSLISLLNVTFSERALLTILLKCHFLSLKQFYFSSDHLPLSMICLLSVFPLLEGKLDKRSNLFYLILYFYSSAWHRMGAQNYFLI